jgi:squalene-hopene/tetraprenyl-beta-curcumene cyclase
MSTATPIIAAPSATVEETLEAAVRCLRARRDPAGWWKGELETNVTIDAEDVLLREFLGIRTGQQTDETARWIRAQQRDDGSWATFHGGPADVSTTVEAWVALRLAGDPPTAAHMAAAADSVRAGGGVEQTRVFTRIWLALFGLWPWDELPDLPPELMLLPSWAPLNIYDFGCWARQTIVPLSVVLSKRPTHPLGFGIDELRCGRRAERKKPWWTLPGLFERADEVLHAYSRLPVHPLRNVALRRATEWIVARQEADGSWGGIQPPWVYSLLALRLMGYPLRHPVMRAGIEGLERFTIREHTQDGWVRRIEACQSPVWDTALAVTALRDAGISAEDPDVVAGARWLLDEEIRVSGDWAVQRPGLAPGGWAFEFDNDSYPDIDDTAEVAMALHRTPMDGVDRVRAREAVARGVQWLVGMQSRDGGWAAFDVDNTSAVCAQLPFCDFGAVTDPPSADVTAHVVESLASVGYADTDACRRGVRWLLAAQEPDGSWFGRWGANYVYGTGAAVPALIAAGIDRTAPAVQAALRWLEEHQNSDGGWGEDLRSYRDPAWIGKGHSTPSQTAWALLALLAARPPGQRCDAVDKGVAWLCAAQRPDGDWDEPWFTGTGFPGDFYIRYHLYRLVFPISALGRYLVRP